jgi:hypothetical protein
MRILTMTAITLLLAATLSAATISDTYVVPVAGHVTGANGETWVTDVTLHNIGATELVVDLSAVAGVATPATVTVAPHGTVALHDVLSSQLTALVLTANAPFTMAARVYTTGARGSVGQSIAPMTDFSDDDRTDSFITGLVASPLYRTNIGFFAAADANDLDVEITLFDAAGTSLGAKTFHVAAAQLAHVQVSSREIAPVSFDAASARVRVVGGSGIVTAYASIVDNISSDGIFVPATVLGDIAPPSVVRRLLSPTSPHSL